MPLPPNLARMLAGRLSIPVIGSPLFIISNPGPRDRPVHRGRRGLVPGAQRTARAGARRLDRGAFRTRWPRMTLTIRTGLSAPFAVNQIVHRSNTRLEADLEVCVRHQVPLVITSLGARPELNEAVHSYGGIVLHDIINDKFARKAIEKGADGLIAVAAGAGGHAGTLSPFALMQEIREPGSTARSRCPARSPPGRRCWQRTGDGGGFRLYRLGLHRDDRGERRRGL